MLPTAFTFAIFTYVVFVAVANEFLKAAKKEAPHLFASWGSPTIGRFVWNRQLFFPFSHFVLFAHYRDELANYSLARRWASWLRVAHWLQLFGFVAFVSVSIFIG